MTAADSNTGSLLMETPRKDWIVGDPRMLTPTEALGNRHFIDGDMCLKMCAWQVLHPLCMWIGLQQRENQRLVFKP
jgi:hypothetical protein